MATAYDTREEQRETEAIRNARVWRRIDDTAFLRSLWATYPHLKPKRVTPDFSWVKDRDTTTEEARHSRAMFLAKHRERILTHKEEFRENKPKGAATIEMVADWFDLPVETLLGRSRKPNVVSARFVAIKLLREMTWDSGFPRFSYPQIGNMLGGRDHSTVIHAETTFFDRGRKYGEQIEAYEALKDA